MKRVRASYKDGLGRVTAVVEDPDSKSYVTRYSYDGRGNLTSVGQSGRCVSSPLSGCTPVLSRSFEYNSRGLVRTAANPEGGAIGYTLQ